jgi:hypothetical protein
MPRSLRLGLSGVGAAAAVVVVVVVVVVAASAATVAAGATVSVRISHGVGSVVEEEAVPAAS